MRKKELIKREVEEEITIEVKCDNCNKKIEYADSCGFGQEYILHDAWCNQCGGKTYDFCSLECLKDFVNKLRDSRKLSEGKI